MGSTKIPPCCLFSIMLDDVASLVHATLHPFYLHIFSGRNPKQSYGAKWSQLKFSTIFVCGPPFHIYMANGVGEWGLAVKT